MHIQSNIPSYAFNWPEMNLDDFASFQRLMGIRVQQANGQYWEMARTFFYRPMWKFEFHPPDTRLPPGAKLGGAQFAVPDARSANSTLNLIVFENTAGYSTEQLHRNERRQIRLAAARFEIRRVDNLAHFKQGAYDAYVSFYSRTRYQVGSRRRESGFFSAWSESLLRIPGILILGGYQGDTLVGISVSFRIGETIDYATFFCNQEALKSHFSDLMLHAIRSSASQTEGARRIFMGLFKGDPGLDDFKFHRGAVLMRQPALLKINPVSRVLLSTLFPRQYQRLLGTLSQEQIRKYAKTQ